MKPRERHFAVDGIATSTLQKYPYIQSTDIWWRVFRILTEPVPYTSVSVNRRNNGARAHVRMWARAPLFRRFTDTNEYTLKYGKENPLPNIRGYTDISTASVERRDGPRT